MSRLLQVCRLVAILALVTIPSTVRGQAWHPFADPMEFDPDYQFFAPVDVDYLEELSPRKRAHTGWFGTYDREYTLVTRANQEGGGSDFTWTNRYEVGLMNEKESGWLFGFSHMGGPNVYEKTYQPRINQYNANDTEGIIVGGTPAVLFPSSGRNDPILGERAYVLGDSVNVAALSSIEANKTFRMEPYRYGGILEPMLGLRYMNFQDYSVNQSYGTSQFLPSTGLVGTNFQTEILTTADWRIDNRMLGGQLGFRYFNHYGRWTLSSELRALAMANYRREHQNIQVKTTEYAGVAVGSAVVTDGTTNTPFIPTQTSSFVPGFELRAQAAYQVTKYIDIRGGINFLDLASNIRRGTVLNGPQFGNAQNNSVQMTGFTFGIAINR
ncbi:MAG: BBP7 family outer membrane beta-barrel protein [Pirellulales bacterium]